MKAIGKAISAAARYVLRQVCAILLSLVILIGTALGATIAALFVAVLGIVFALLVMIAPLLGLSASAMAEAIKKKAVGASDNVHQFRQPESTQ